MSELDSTYALLSSNLPVGGDPNSVKKKSKPKPTSPAAVFVDSDEDEIFFGERTDKELCSKNSKFTRRETLHLGNAIGRRSIDVVTTPKNHRIWTDYRSKNENSMDQDSLSSVKNVIEEENENEENVAPIEEMTVKPSPRKVYKDLLKISDLDKKLDEWPTPPRRYLYPKQDNQESSPEEPSILDVHNDQIFDDSIFTEYDEKNLSCYSAKMSKKWRKKWAKEDSSKNTFSANTIDRLVAKQASLVKDLEEEKEPVTPLEENDLEALAAEELAPEVPEKENDESIQNASTFSDYFNTTRDEMILYEKFGEDYDDIVNKMSHEEKLKLKEEVAKSVPKEVSELINMHNNEKSIHQIQETPNVSFRAPQQQIQASSPPGTPIPKPRTKTPSKETRLFDDITQANNHDDQISKKLATPSNHVKRYFKSPMSMQSTPNYARPTTASKLRTSPRKNLSPGLFRNYEEEAIAPCPRAGLDPSPFEFKHKSLKKVQGMGINLNHVVSPVSQYIKHNPVPPIVRQIHPKATKHFDDDLAAFERDEEMCKSPQEPTEEPKRMFKPLPMAQYKSSRVALEQPAHDRELKSLPKFGLEETVEAKVVRHIGRERVPKDAGFLNGQSHSPMGGTLTVRKNADRESMMPNATMDETNTMEMSIRQVVEVRKMTSAWHKN